MGKFRPQPWYAIAVLVVLAGLVLWTGPRLGIKGDVLGALTGALIGATGVLLGIILDRQARRADERSTIEEKRARIKTLVTADLVNLAVGLIQANDFMVQSIRTFPLGAAPGIIDLSGYAPRPMPVVALLGSDILTLSEREIDVLATLAANLTMSRETFAQQGTLARPFGTMEATFLKGLVANDMQVLAQAFEEFAPTRKLQPPGKEPELASSLLRRAAQL